MHKPIMISATAFNERALAAVAQVAAQTGMSKSQAAAYLILKGSGLLKTGPTATNLVQKVPLEPTAD